MIGGHNSNAVKPRMYKTTFRLLIYLKRNFMLSLKPIIQSHYAYANVLKSGGRYLKPETFLV